MNELSFREASPLPAPSKRDRLESVKNNNLSSFSIRHVGKSNVGLRF